MALPVIGIVVSLAVLLVLAYRGHSVVAVAPIAALVAAIFSGAPLLATYTQIFMPALGKFIVSFFPLFIAGAIFGKLMSSSGLAADLAHGISKIMGPRKAMFSTVLATALLTYGGVSAWVVAFTIVPIASALFKEAGIPKRLMPAALALGTITFALAALPGSPQVHNVIPTKYFGTTTYAAPVLGLIGTVMMFGLGMAWLQYRIRTLKAAGELYLPEGVEDVEHSPDESPYVDPDVEPNPHLEPGHLATHVEQPDAHTHHDVVAKAHDDKWGLRAFLGFLPVAVVIGMNYAFLFFFTKHMDFSYLADKKFGETNITAVQGVWSVVVAIVTAIILIFAMRPKMIPQMMTELSEGAKNAILPCFTTASEVGYGAVVASLAVFAAIKTEMFNIGGDALIVGVISTAVISGITGSSSGGLSITMEAFADQLQTMAATQNISVETLHRIIAMASVSFDSLPHNGAILTMLLVCNMSHKQSYKDIAMVTIVVPIIVLLILLTGVELMR
ncbi:GntP family permease [Corynebacterium aquilae]|uniref:Transporter n=1 Tax=Corynebacterium aquilae DSM 44791 TaxID=1431546 RepID=A0A1L7CHT4_9CORY|nr:SLC13 family permease [Corynebacterium aquilae]APT85417.1 transporter [Corynebacterium aquilae DSM 44791]